MLSTHTATSIRVPYEEDINGFTIYVEDNPDRWCGGYQWALCKDEVELDAGLECTIADALQRAYSIITVM